MRAPLIAAALLIVAAPAQAQTVVLVRHAEKAAEPAADPPLTTAGEARARALASALRRAGVRTILTSPTRRTADTAAPLAAETGVASRTVPLAGGIERHVAAVTAAVRAAPEDSTVLVVGHSNTVPAIARALGFSGATAIADCRYDDMLVLRLDRGGANAVTARYGAPSTC